MRIRSRATTLTLAGLLALGTAAGCAAEEGNVEEDVADTGVEEDEE